MILLLKLVLSWLFEYFYLILKMDPCRAFLLGIFLTTWLVKKNDSSGFEVCGHAAVHSHGSTCSPAYFFLKFNILILK